MDRRNIEKIAHDQEGKLMLAKLWDKIQAGISRDIPANAGFLSPREQELCRYLFGNVPGLHYFGGYEDAERRMPVYLPEYMDEDSLVGLDSPVVCLRASYYEGDTLSHRDFLGALMASGISRETVGDICVSKGSCDFFVTREIAPYILQNFTGAGRTKLRISAIAIADAVIPQPEIRIIADTLASLRLDGLVSSGFRMGRSAASELIRAGKCSVNGLPCTKPDKLLGQGDKISLRGSGKLMLAQVNGQTKKGRISVVIHRYI